MTSSWHSYLEMDGAPRAAAAPTRKPEATPRRGDFRTTGRPTYAPTLQGTFSSVPRTFAYGLITQFYKQVPIIGRALNILAGLTGCPAWKSENPETQKELKKWAGEVKYGKIGKGLASWLPDHLRQSILYGYGVGEMVASPLRDDIERLWSYRSPCFQIESNGTGDIQIIQPAGLDGTRTVLNENSVLHTAHQPEGCDPHGQPLFFACSTFNQLLIDVFHAHGSTWRRSGIPTYHLNWQPFNPDTFSDPDGSVGTAIKDAMATEWSAAMKSAVVNGLAQDFFSSGQVTITSIGADMAPMDITESTRAILEELVLVTGIPPLMFGLSWSSTERMSSVQADLLVSTIDSYRTMAGGTIGKVAETRQLLRGDNSPWELGWPDLSLQDLEATARAAQMDAQADLTRLKVAERRWQLGFCDQKGAAKYATGEETIVKVMAEPPSPMPEEKGGEGEPKPGGENGT